MSGITALLARIRAQEEQEAQTQGLRVEDWRIEREKESLRQKEQSKLRDLERWKRREIERLIPPRFLFYSLADFRGVSSEQDHDLEELERWIGKPKDSLAIVGGVGRGKTTLAYATIRSLIQSNLHCEAINVPEFLDALRRSYGQNGSKMSDQVDQYLKADLLMLDDLGSERATEWTIETLYVIINRRYETMRPILVTTNLSLRAFLERADAGIGVSDRHCASTERVYSRLLELIQSHLIVLRGPNRRRRPVEAQI